MPPQAHKTKLTYEDFALFPEDGKRHELIDGEHFVTPSPATRHQRISRNLMHFLDTHLRRTNAGEVLAAPMDVVLSNVDIVEPDILVILAARASIITAKNIQGAPDLVVEIISESTRKTDILIKRRLYERHGVPEYWIVDPELEAVDVYRLADGKFIRSAELSLEAGHSIETPLLPGFQLRLSEIFP